MKPVAVARISQPFADPGSYASSSDPHGPSGHHTGCDWGSDWGADPGGIGGNAVRSVLPGVVVIADYNSTMGNWVGVYNPKRGVLYTYWHLLGRAVRLGQEVTRGRVVGGVGSTGNSTAAHLHVQANRGRAFNYAGHVKPRAAFGLPWPKVRGGRLVLGDMHGSRLVEEDHADAAAYDGQGA